MIGSRLKILATVAVVASTGFQAPARAESIHELMHLGVESVAATMDGSTAKPDDRRDMLSPHRTADALRHVLLRTQRADPEWLVRGNGVAPVDYAHGARATPRLTYVAVQTDRLDGMDLITVRRSLQSLPNLRLYAGAGLGRTSYINDDALAKPLPRRRAQHSLVTAAELGARAHLGERVSVDAALRWAKLGRDVALLQSDSGVTSADAIMLGVTVAYRFR
jgi:hypothetical protein